MKQPQRGDGSDFVTTLTVSNNETQTTPCSTSTTSNNGRVQNLKVSAPIPQSFPATAFGLHFAPNYQLTMSPVLIQQPSASANSSRSKATKLGRPPPCHHARYVLDDRPPRSSTANENMECTNCGTKNTSAWRRSAEGKSECNACNLFFRKNGRKRPPSMRRDTISRRYRLSRCDLCAMEAQGGQSDFVQFQKTVARQRRNGKASTKASAQQPNDTPLPSTLPAKPEQTNVGETSFFVPHPEYPPNFPLFMPPNVEYSHRSPVMMGYTMDRSVFGMRDVEQPLNRLNNGEICFDSHPHGVVRSAEDELYGHHLLMPPEPAVPLKVCKQETIHEQFSVSQADINSGVSEQYEQFDQAAQHYGSLTIDKKLPADELINGSHLNKQRDEFKVVKQEETQNGFMVGSAPEAGSFAEVQQENTSPRVSAFDLLSETPEDENMLVFRSL